MIKFTFVCENAGSFKLKKLTWQQVNRNMKNPRLIFMNGGVHLEADLAYRSGSWRLSSPGGTFCTFDSKQLPQLIEMTNKIRGH